MHFINRKILSALESKHKAVYTVEASVIITLCFIMFGIAVGITYRVYGECVQYVGEDLKGFDAVYEFREKEKVEEAADIIAGDMGWK